jgi:hypothetical protein
MQITITGRQLDLGDALRAHIETGPEGASGRPSMMVRGHFHDRGLNGGGHARDSRNSESTS